MSNIAVITLSQEGAELARQIIADLGGDLFVHSSCSKDYPQAKEFDRVIDLTSEIFQHYRNLIYIMPSGVVSRAIAPHICSKYSDPAIVVLDVLGRFAISFLSGHEGGANNLALQIGNLTGAEPVITTTTEVVKRYIIGIGCRKDTPKRSILALLYHACETAEITPDTIRYIATINLKATEPGILQAAAELGIPLRIIQNSEINNTCYAFDDSEFVRKNTGVGAVAEPCALLAGRRTKLILRKITENGVTAAVARECSE